ncbi:MAG TPA: FAD-binding oxidoreductase [Sumerlaeia bacterium]|nr:FAD-binding oxidoreductase [Sumerlaeia bacterium]
MTTCVLAILSFTVVVVGLSMLLDVAARKLQNYGLCVIDINDGEESVEIEGGATLLSSLGERKIFIPGACGGQGTCALCKVRVLDGGGPVLPTETPFLSRTERLEHVRLSCQVKVKTDMRVRMPAEYLRVQEYRATVESVTQQTVDIYTIRMKLVEPAELTFRVGQFIQVKAPNPKGGEPVYRAYSISNPDNENNICELVVRLIPGGICSTYLCQTIKPGDEVIFNGPFGEFVLNEDPECELVCVGGGSGMAPMKSIVFSVLNKQPNRKVWLFFGCRAVKDIFYREMFEELEAKHPDFKVVYALSEMDEGDQWDGETGFIHLAVDKMVEDGGRKQAFFCGPPLMSQAATAVMREKGCKKRDIFFDDFGI